MFFYVLLLNYKKDIKKPLKLCAHADLRILYGGVSRDYYSYLYFTRFISKML